MDKAADSSQSEALGALSVVARHYDVSRGSGDALAALTSAGVEALCADGGGIVSVDRNGVARALTTVGLSPEASAALAEAALAAPSAGGDDQFNRTAFDAPALCLPLAAPPGVGGSLVLVGAGVERAEPAALKVAEAAAVRAGSFIECARLRSDLDRAMAQILETDERMMGRIGLDIHDGPTQQLSVALLEVQLLEAELDDLAAAGKELPGEVRPALMRIYETLGGALHEMRELIGHLRPAQFEDRPLDEILRDAAVAFEARGDAAVAMTVEGDFRVNGVSVSQRITFYRVLQEALSNAQRHGGASRIEVRLRGSESGVELVVSDDGSGFDTSAAFRKSEHGPQSRVGLMGMRDRAQVLGGTFEVQSSTDGGTAVRLHIPAWTPLEPTDAAS